MKSACTTMQCACMVSLRKCNSKCHPGTTCDNCDKDDEDQKGCKCGSGCGSKKCKCFKMGVFCNEYCHVGKSHLCVNCEKTKKSFLFF